MKRLQLFPDTTKIVNNTLTIAGDDLDSLADEYETPLFLYDRETMDKAVTEYKRCLTRIVLSQACHRYISWRVR
jgi:diaminopimelate decarboxylase